MNENISNLFLTYNGDNQNQSNLMNFNNSLQHTYYSKNQYPNLYSNVFSLAKSFLCISEMTHKKLQKLCYYAKAWYLALYDENLITEDFQAWVHGAVQPSLYQYYRKYRFNPIPLESSSIGIPEEFLSFSQKIYESYGDLTGDELEALNHREDPWINARKDCKPWENSNNVIKESDMKIYYRKLLQ